jgi:3-deoxy-manno-octulosonate cytidylyltransferase (CMP-KDO synthetase)
VTIDLLRLFSGLGKLASIRITVIHLIRYLEAGAKRQPLLLARRRPGPARGFGRHGVVKALGCLEGSERARDRIYWGRESDLRGAALENKLRIAAVIPARLASERLPGKVLRMLEGRAMLHHVYDTARAGAILDDLLVATDSEEVRRYCERNQIPVRMTSSSHRSGTERIHEVMKAVPADVFLNLQADEPLLAKEHLGLLVDPFRTNPATQVSTLKTLLDDGAASNPNVVKVVTDLRGQALCFSRAPIPFHRDPAVGVPYYKHLGLYGYRREALERYIELPPSPLERTERLEQMRFLENGIPIYVAETAHDTIGVDTEEDWQAVFRLFETRR